MAWLYKRNKNYWVGYKHNGQVIRKSLHIASLAMAKTLLAEYQILEAKEANHSNILILDRNIEDVVYEYLEHSKLTNATKTLEEKESALSRFRIYLDSRIVKISDLNLSLIEPYIQKRIKESVYGANKDLKIIKNLLNYAVSRGYIRDNPAKTLKNVKMPKKIFRCLTFAEIDRLLDTARAFYPALYPLLATAYYTGLREKELVYLEWSDIDFNNNTVHVRSKAENRVKDCEERIIPLNKHLKDILGVPQRDRFIFHTPSGTTWKNNLYREVKKVVKSATLSKISLQTLRETFGSHLLRRGVSIYLVSKYLGHSSVDVTTRHYAYIPIETTHEAINVL